MELILTLQHIPEGIAVRIAKDTATGGFVVQLSNGRRWTTYYDSWALEPSEAIGRLLALHSPNAASSVA